ncbi:MAG: DNA polymerase III subunit delta [Chitinophagales bacterium]
MATTDVQGPENFRRDLGSGTLPRLLVLTGAEQRLKAKACEALLEKLGAKDQGEFNFAQFDGAEADQDAFFAAAFAPPLFAGRRVVVVRRCEEAAWLEALPRYLPDLPESTTLILVAGEPADGTGGRPGRASALAQVLKAAGEHGRCYDFPALRRQDFLPYLRAEAARRSLTLTPAAVEALRAKLGTDLAGLETELEKLAVYCGPEGGRIDAPDVAALVGQTAFDNSFALVDAVLTSDTGAALRILQDLLAAGEAPQAILAQLGAQFRRVVVVKAAAAEDWPGTRLLKPLELSSSWAAEKVRDQARRITLDRAERALAAILRTDWRLKRQRGLLPEVELAVLAAELCQPERASR